MKNNNKIANLELKEDSELINMIKERIKNKSRVLSEEEFNKRNGINEDFLKNLPDVELE